MKLAYTATVAACAIISCAGHAQAVTIAQQNSADFVNLPSTSVSPFTAQTTGTVFFNQLGSVRGVYRSPFENALSGNGAIYNTSNHGWQQTGFDTLAYTSVEAKSSATFTFAAAETTLSLLWGSPDSYNSIAFFAGKNGTGLSEGIILGNDLGVAKFGHDQVSLTLGGLFFQSVVLYSGGPSFEFANLLATHPSSSRAPLTPVPAALPLFASGLGVIGFVYGRISRKKAAPTAVS